MSYPTILKIINLMKFPHVQKKYKLRYINLS